MGRIDIARLRKDRGISQSELAQQLQVTQSFLSAIENGKSPLPPEKEVRIMEIFNLHDLDSYTIDPLPAPAESAPKSVADMTEGDLFNQLLTRFHQHAHEKEGHQDHHHDHHDRIEALEDANSKMLQRNDALMQRNDRLAADNDRLREDNDRLREEIFRLKSLLIENDIKIP